MDNQTETAMFGAGCFWGVEHAFQKVEGVVSTCVGYSGGHSENPTYKQVCSGGTGHAEVVKVEYDPSIVSYERLLDVFWEIHDPTQLNCQGPDIGEQYRSAIFFYSESQKQAAMESIDKEKHRFMKAIVTQVAPAGPFYPAEEYHQRYVEKNSY